MVAPVVVTDVVAIVMVGFLAVAEVIIIVAVMLPGVVVVEKARTLKLWPVSTEAKSAPSIVFKMAAEK